MPNEEYKQAVREAYSSNLNDPIIKAVKLKFSGFSGGVIYLIQNNEDLTLTLEDGVTTQLFTAISMSITTPSVDSSGGSALSIRIDNTGIPLFDYINTLISSEDSLIVEYNEYLASDLNTPQIVTPITTECESILFNDSLIEMKCNIADIVNLSFCNKNYTRSQYPGLGNIT